MNNKQMLGPEWNIDVRGSHVDFLFLFLFVQCTLQGIEFNVSDNNLVDTTKQTPDLTDFFYVVQVNMQNSFQIKLKTKSNSNDSPNPHLPLTTYTTNKLTNNTCKLYTLTR